MNTSISKEFSGRFAGALYVAAASLLLVYTFVPAFDTIDKSLTRQAALTILVAGLGAIAFPWGRIPRWIQLSLPLYAVILAIFVPGMIDADPALGYPFLLLIFVWVAINGNWGLVLSFFILTSGVMALAMGLESSIGEDQLLIAIDTMFVGLIVGLTLSFTMTKLQRARVRAKAQRNALETLIVAVEELATELSVDGVGTHISDYACNLMGAIWSTVVVLDAELEVMIRYNSGPVKTMPAESWQMPISVWEEIRRGGVLVTTPHEPPCWTDADMEGVGSVLWVPLRGANEPLGAIAIGLKEKPAEVGPFIQSTARGLASQGALAFERVRLTLSLLDQSMRDELTGVGNRRHAMALLSRVAVGDGVMVLDLDHFKEVNDSFGHDRGDELLGQLAAYLGEALRDQDAVARYGGDEFLAILWGVGDKAEEVTQRLVDGWRGLAPMASLSVGVAVHEVKDTTNATFQRADAALYEAKHRGRDQGVVLSAGESVAPHGQASQGVSSLFQEEEETQDHGIEKDSTVSRS